MANCSKQLNYKAARINELLDKIDKGYVLTKDLLDKLQRIDDKQMVVPDYTATLEFVESEGDAVVEKVSTEYGYNFNFKLPKAGSYMDEDVYNQCCCCKMHSLKFGDGLVYKNGVVSLVPPNFNVKINTSAMNVRPNGKVTGDYPNLILELTLPRGCCGCQYGPTGDTGETGPTGPTDSPTGSTGGTGTIPDKKGRIYYGYVPYDATGQSGYTTMDECAFDKVTKVLLAKGKIVDIEPAVMNKTDVGNGIIPAGARIYVLVPKATNYTVTKDNGFGGKVPFDPNGGGQCANGNYEVTIDEVVYKVYGEDITSDAQIYIYVD